MSWHCRIRRVTSMRKSGDANLATKDIDVRPLSLKNLFDKSFYSIDFYQREYVWGEEEVRTLVVDLCEAFNDWVGAREYRRKPDRAPQYFLGPFVYYDDQDRDLRYLVDGQQRFTTLHLVFMSLRNIARQLDERAYDGLLNQVIRGYGNRSRPRYRVDIADRSEVLDAIYDDKLYEPSRGDSLSVRNLWQRSQEIEPLLRSIPPELYTSFVDWVLTRVVMAGIQASDSNNAFRIFESMNDRGARLTPVDLLKSYLLANAGGDEAILNDRWRHMLAELTSVRDDRTAPGQFLKAAFQGQFARLDGDASDIASIDSALNLWVRRNEALLGLVRADRFHALVERLIKLATTYRTFLHASRSLQPGLEEIYYNERNGLGAQMIAILAAVRAEDVLTVAKDKARRIAAFIDRWYVLRTLTEDSVGQRDLMQLIRTLLPGLRGCRTAEEVSGVLAEQVIRDDPEAVTLENFGLRGTNRNQVKYLLARLTAYAMDGVGRRGAVDEYLDDARPYQIEHLFANKPERHQKEFPDPVAFRSQRNQFGGLVLLPYSENAGLGAMPLDEKVQRYGKENVLVGVLNKDFHLNFKNLREFIKRNQVEQFMRPFGHQTPMAEVISVRRELYLRLSAQIWSLESMGIDDIPGYKGPFAVDAGDKGAPAPAKSRPKTDVARMVAAGVIQSGQRIVMAYKGADHWAEIGVDGRVSLEATGIRYNKVDDAGCIVRDSKTCNGMLHWYVPQEDGTRVNLRTLRDKAREEKIL